MDRFFWKRFIGSLLIALVSLQLTRLIFLINLKNYFQVPTDKLLEAFVFGTRFDLVSIAYLLGPFYLALPFLSTDRKVRFFKWYFLIALGAINLLNCIDAEFFKFTARRSTHDLFEFAFLSDDLFNIAPNLLSHFWYLLAALVVIMLVCWCLMELLFSSTQTVVKDRKRFVLVIPIVLFLIIAARGGLQPIPITIIDASKTARAELNPL
ncbi:MAG: hypothetical protein RL266_1587, partial [Bacteroidota bacterium]